MEEQKQPNRPLLFTVPDAAEILAIGERTLWRHIAAERVKAVRIGNSVRITRVELERIADRGVAA